MPRTWKPAQGARDIHLDLSSVPETVQVDLCVLAIRCTARAMESPEGRAAIEKHREAYLQHLKEREEAMKAQTSVK